MTSVRGRLVGLLAALVAVAAGLAVAPTTAQAHTGGFPSVGTAFGEAGPYEVTVFEDGEHTFYHPSVMGEGGVHHPVIIWGNGTGTGPSTYQGLHRHWASHGFIVAAANTPNAMSGQEMLAGFEKLAAWNAEEGSKFNGMVNVDTAGASGHSQGAFGAVATGRNEKVATVFPIQGGFSAAGVTGTAFFLSGQNDTIIAPANVKRAYEGARVPAVYGEAAGATHFTPIGTGGAYRYATTAWARMMLMDDTNAHQVFVGDDCTLCTSGEWSEFATNDAFDGMDLPGEAPAEGEAPGEGDGHGHGGETPTEVPTEGETPTEGHGHGGEQPSVGDGDGSGVDSPAAPARPEPRSRFSRFLRVILSRWFGGAGVGAPTTPAPTTPTTQPTTPTTAPGDHGHAPGTPDDHGHGEEPAGTCTPQAYDATLPVELCGFPGVSAEQEAEAEALVTRTIERLPQFADVADAQAAGFHSIGDALTGYEHFINWGYIRDEHQLNPDYPESLVYRVEGGQKTLHAAMYMLDEGQGLDDVPEEVGGPMVQWHVHNDLCFTDDPVAPRVSGIRRDGGPCVPGGVPAPPVPMVHVWIVPHECGPFSALEGIGGGQVAEGEEKLCDDVHGHGGDGHGH